MNVAWIVLALVLAVLAAALGVALRRTIIARDTARRRAADAEQARALAEARLADHAQNETRLREMVDSLAAKALHANSEEFLKLARSVFETEQKQAAGALEQRKQAVESLVKPLQESVKATHETLRALEEERVKEYGALRQFTLDVARTSDALRTETGKLVQALRKPQVRGRYGEIQLERVVELAGLRSYCDFSVQTTATGDDGARIRPDMIVRLPNERVVVIDAKTNIDGYLDALDAPDTDAAENHLKRFARHVLNQAKALAKKDYATIVGSAPEFVVMFIPGDQFVDAALEREPDLLDLAASDGVIIASPSTLIGLLRAVHVGWREKRLSDSANELFELGKTFHERAATLLGYIADLGRAIDATRDRYNTVVGSVDGRLMPVIRKFEDGGARSSKDAPAPIAIDGEVRALHALPDAQPGPV